MFVRSARMIYLRVHNRDDDDLLAKMITEGFDSELGFHTVEGDTANAPARAARERRSVVVRLALRRRCGDLLRVEDREASLEGSLLEMRIDDVAGRCERSLDPDQSFGCCLRPRHGM